MAAPSSNSNFPEASLATLAARAAMLEERLAPEWQPVKTPEGAARAARLWARWEQLLPGGGEAALRDRLALARWTPARARARLGDGRWRPGAALPEWTETWRAVRAALLAVKTTPEPEEGAAKAADAAAAWTEFFRPFVQAGEVRLQAEAQRRGGVLEAAIAAEFRALLARRLEVIGRAALEFEFGLFREARRGAEDWFGGAAGEPATRAAFSAELARTGAGRLEENYPVLLRQCCEQVQLLAAAWGELAARLAADGAELAARFGRSRPLGGVTGCHGGLSDPHRGAHSAVELRFRSGVHLVYKPRPMALEAGYFSLIAWLEARGARPRLGSVGVWDCGDYGWMEWVGAAPCANRAAARRHFTRTGAHLALLHVLGGADFHSENWIAAGEFPQPVDLEVLLRPGATAGVAGEIEQSVLGVGLLPVWQAAAGSVANISALGDAARAGAAARPEAGAHRARLAGRTLSAADFAAEIAGGFSAMRAALQRHRRALLGAQGPLAALRRARARHVARPTETYVRLLGLAAQPRALGDGAACSLEFERLAKALAGVPASEARQRMQLVAAEQRALARLDVPLLHARADRRGLETGEGPAVPRFFAQSGWAALRRRLEVLGPMETRKQAGLIQAAFAVARLGGPELTKARAPAPRAASSDARPPTSATLLAAARKIGHELAAEAVAVECGITWVAPQLLPGVERFQLAMLGPGLYDGAAGVGLFFAALHQATGEAEWARLARGALGPAVAALTDPAARRHLHRLPAGAGVGRAGLVYALTRTAGWLGQPGWLASQRRLVELLEPRDGDAGWDVMGGAAGAILGALRLGEATRDEAPVRLAVEWGRRLVAAQEAMPAGGRAWRHEGVALGGMAHGAAGGAAALAQLAAATGEQEFRRAAADAIAFEATLFLAGQNNWVDLRGAREVADARRAGRCALAWCHGAPGTVLARLAGLPGLDTAPVRADIAAGLITLAAAPAGEIDQCCCGEAGVIDILASASAVLERPELMTVACQRAGRLLAKTRAAGAYNAFGAVALPAGPGFFQGRAGIGYAWLRLAQPERFPSVLAFA